MKNVVIKKANYAILLFLMCSRLSYYNTQNKHTISANNNTTPVVVNADKGTEISKDTVYVVSDKYTTSTIVADKGVITNTPSGAQVVITLTEGDMNAKIASKNHIHTGKFFITTSELQHEYVPIAGNHNVIQVHNNNFPAIYTNARLMGSFNGSNITTIDSSIVLGFTMFITGASLIILKFSTINKVKKGL
jgi:hypothetical protein